MGNSIYTNIITKSTIIVNILYELVSWCVEALESWFVEFVGFIEFVGLKKTKKISVNQCKSMAEF